MDRKSIIVLAVSLMLMFVYYWLVNRIWPPPQTSHRTNWVATATNSITPESIPPTNLTASRSPAGALVASDAPEQLRTVENDNVRYTFTSHGGGLKLAEFKKYPELVACRTKKGQPTNRVATINTRAPTPAFALLGGTDLQGDGQFTLTKMDNGVRAEKTLPSGVHLVKEFQPATNYLIMVTVRLENRTGQSVQLPAAELVVATATPIGPHDNG